MTDNGLFEIPTESHPDQQIAHEEITRYYDERVDEARRALAAARAVLDERLTEQAAWRDRREITPDVVGNTDLAPHSIAGASIDRYHEASRPLIAQMDTVGGRVVNRSSDAARLRAEAERCGEREKALRRWLTAQGHDLGALAEPPAKGPRAQRGRRR